MNVGVPRIVALRRGVARLEPSVRALVTWLASHQDRASGFWGPSQGSALHEGLGAAFHVCVVLEAAGQPPPSREKVASTILDLWREPDGWGDSWMTMAALSLLSKTVHASEHVAERARELAEASARTLALQKIKAATYGATTSTLSEIVTCLEGLRAASKLTDDPALAPCREWRSAWEPGLWACEW
jgi:hypothetical protein